MAEHPDHLPWGGAVIEPEALRAPRTEPVGAAGFGSKGSEAPKEIRNLERLVVERPAPPTQVRTETSSGASSRTSDAGAGTAAGAAPPEPATPDMFPVAFVTDPASSTRSDTAIGEPASPSKTADANRSSAVAPGAKGSIGKVAAPIPSCMLTRDVLSMTIFAKRPLMLQPFYLLVLSHA